MAPYLEGINRFYIQAISCSLEDADMQPCGAVYTLQGNLQRKTPTALSSSNLRASRQ